jgi:hypothetical protein
MNTCLWIIDIGNPAMPTTAGVLYPPTGVPFGCSVMGGIAYIANMDNFLVADVSNPASPFIIGQCNLPSYIFGVYVVSPYAYTTNHYAGFRIVDISNPSAPADVGHYSTIDVARGIHTDNSYIYVMEGSIGLQIYQNLIPAVSENPDNKSPSMPMQLLHNPVISGSLRVKLHATQKMTVNLSLYDISGRLVRKFSKINLYTGNQILDLDIRHIPAGVYFLRSDGEDSYPGLKVIILQ